MGKTYLIQALRVLVVVPVVLMLAVLVGCAGQAPAEPPAADAEALLVRPEAFTASCGPRASILEHLLENFGETPTSVGLSDSGNLFEIITSPDATWTALLTLPNGYSCFLASGGHWQTVDKPGRES